MTGNHFKATILFGTDDGRNQDAMLLHTVSHFHHAFVHADLERMVRKFVDQINGNILHSGLTGNLPFLLGGEQVI